MNLKKWRIHNSSLSRFLEDLPDLLLEYNGLGVKKDKKARNKLKG